MQYLFKLWDWLNEMLAYPLIQLLAGVLITAFPFLFRRVRELALCYLTPFWTWIGRQPALWLKKAFRLFGIASQKDLDELRTELRQAIKPTSVPLPAQAVAPRTVTRGGTKIKVKDEVWRHLGKEDPLHLDSKTLDRIFQGPFCEKCSYSLPEYNENYMCYYISFRCPHCSYKPSNNLSYMSLDQFKVWVYRGLDAEFQRTGIIKDNA
jgi:hypothetical protein